MKRRKHLHVDTFPFLAVLLCAMGGLILVLLVMDRKSRQAALSREQEKVNVIAKEQQAEYEQLTEEQRREYELKKRAAQESWEKKRLKLQAHVVSEEDALNKELAQVRARLAEAARKLLDDQRTLAELRQQLAQEKDRLAQQEIALGSSQRHSAKSSAKLKEGDRTRARLSEELARLEKLLAQALNKQSKDANSYSVVPYHGKRGEDRRPVYIECGPAAYIFHPEKKILERGGDLREELQARVEKQRQLLRDDGIPEKPYLLFLIRPDEKGIARFYEGQATAKEMNVDFGFEFVEADWVFHFPQGDLPQKPKMASGERKGTGSRGSVPTTSLLGHAPSGTNSRPGSVIPALGAPRIASSAQGNFPGSSENGVEGSGTIPAGKGPMTHGIGVGTDHPDTKGSNENRSIASGSREGSPAGPRPLPSLDKPLVSLARPATGSPAHNPTSSDIQLAPPTIATNTGKGDDPDRITIPPLIPNHGSGASGGSPSSTGSAGGTAQSSGSANGKGEAIGQGQSGDGPRPKMLRPARVSGDRDSIIYIECRNDVVIVHPTRKQIAIESLNHSPAYNPLVQAVHQLVQTRQRQAKAGDHVRLGVRFLVHRDGERTLHIAYPALEVLRLKMDRYTLQKWDDVSRLVAEQ